MTDSRASAASPALSKEIDFDEREIDHLWTADDLDGEAVAVTNVPVGASGSRLAVVEAAADHEIDTVWSSFDVQLALFTADVGGLGPQVPDSAGSGGSSFVDASDWDVDRSVSEKYTETEESPDVLLDDLPDFEPEVRQPDVDISVGTTGIDRLTRNRQVAYELAARHGWSEPESVELLCEILEPLQATGRAASRLNEILGSGLEPCDLRAAFSIRKAASQNHRWLPPSFGRKNETYWLNENPFSWDECLQLGEMLRGVDPGAEAEWIVDRFSEALWEDCCYAWDNGTWNGPRSVGSLIFDASGSGKDSMSLHVREYLVTYGNEVWLDDDGDPIWSSGITHEE